MFDRRSAIAALMLAAIALMASSGCGPTEVPEIAVPRYASAEAVELNFRGHSFILGNNNVVALVRPVNSHEDQYLRLPFWFGINVLVPGVMAPKEGDYYVISEAMLEKPLDAPGEWMIEAGSSLVKRETVLVTTRTHYDSTGKILPTIVQYIGNREFTTPEGDKIELPVLREVSLPAKWTLGGGTPASYARYRIE